jgi:collagenase-like PrtC family protease
MLKEAVKSDCDIVRFGSEFCEWKIPSLNTLEKAYNLTNDWGKEFVYITPRVSNNNLEKIRDHLNFFNEEKKNKVVVNDLGTLNILKVYPKINPHLGRQLVYIPARCPWNEITEHDVGFLTKRKITNIFYQTSLNYKPTIQFFQKLGVQGVDVDWIPQCIPHYNFLLKNGLDLSVHVYLVPVTLTRRCHTARFLGEKDPENCTQPCSTQAFVLRHDVLGIELFLHGNTVFTFNDPANNDIKQLRNNADQLVIAMTPATKIDSQQEINALITRLKS